MKKNEKIIAALIVSVKAIDDSKRNSDQKALLAAFYEQNNKEIEKLLIDPDIYENLDFAPVCIKLRLDPEDWGLKKIIIEPNTFTNVSEIISVNNLYQLVEKDIPSKSKNKKEENRGLSNQ